MASNPEARTDPRLQLPPRAERFGAARAQSQRRWRIAFAAVALAFALVLAFASWAQAWTLAISGHGVCNERTGEYDLAWRLDNTSEPEAATVTGDLSATVPAYGHKIVTESVPGSTSGSVSRTIRINWPSDQANLRRVGTIEGLSGDCKKTPPVEEEPPTEEQPPVVSPPVEKTPKPQVGPPTSRKRAEPTPDDSPELGTPPTVEQPPTGALPFTGLREWLLPIGLALVTAGGAMVLAGRRRYQQMTLAARAVDRAMHKPYRGPHERL